MYVIGYKHVRKNYDRVQADIIYSTNPLELQVCEIFPVFVFTFIFLIHTHIFLGMNLMYAIR